MEEQVFTHRQTGATFINLSKERWVKELDLHTFRMQNVDLDVKVYITGYEIRRFLEES